MSAARHAVWLVLAVLAACAQAPEQGKGSATRTTETAKPGPTDPAADTPGARIEREARRQIGVTVRYNPAYRRIAYPGGDVPVAEGVCTDVVIRALRPLGLDLQHAIHEDMAAHFAAYPQRWQARAPDASIDHRRVPNVQRWFERNAASVPITDHAGDYRAGDVVTWQLPDGRDHIGVVTSRWNYGQPSVIHNIGRGAREEYVLFAWPVTGHYRPATVLAPQARS